MIDLEDYNERNRTLRICAKSLSILKQLSECKCLTEFSLVKEKAKQLLNNINNE